MEYGTMINGQYKVIGTIGQGGFGTLHKVIDVTDPGQKQYALKVENRNTHALIVEHQTYKMIHSAGIIPGFPKVHYFGEHNSQCALVMDLLGSSMRDLMRSYPENALPLNVVLFFAHEIVNHLEVLHESNIVHNDLKPHNILLGPNKDECKLYLIDLGLATQFRDAETGEHVPQRHTKSPSGTFSYCSKRALQRHSPSRRDDIEAFVYTIVTMTKGKLPWSQQSLQGIGFKGDRIGFKLTTPPSQVCVGLPGEFLELLQYSMGMGFEEKPDYEYIRKLFRSAMGNDTNYDPKRVMQGFGRETKTHRSVYPS